LCQLTNTSVCILRTGLGTNIIPGEEMRNAQSETKNKIIWESDGFAGVLPSDKREVVMTLRNHFGLVTGMTGWVHLCIVKNTMSSESYLTHSPTFIYFSSDGVNDAPALLAAQVGIAVDGATDAAKNAADLILTEPGLSPIYGAVLESRRIFARIKGMIVYYVL
jgi:H+-transporting ATPase